jgi:ankyrin repeat protein
MAACLTGQTEIVKLLISKGADVRAKDAGQQTAMKYAKTKGHDEIVALLKKAGARE